MATTTRRNLLKAAALGGVSATGLSVLSANGGTASAAGQKPGKGDEHAHDNRPLTDKRAMTTVSFGQWDVDPLAPFDRHPLTSVPNRNLHLHLPFEAEVDAGGAVSFVISGLHQIVIYGDGNTYEGIRAAALAATPIAEIFPYPALPLFSLPPLINYVPGRVFRGLDPRVLNYSPGTSPAFLVVDRVESVNFKEPGRYLVVCGVRPHFEAGMYGYVNVKA
jgi:plastocyanin